MQTPIKTAYKTFLLAVITVLLGLVSSGARADAPTFNATVNGTNYDFTYVTGTFNANSNLLQSQPWWGNDGIATTFAEAVGTHLGLPTLNIAGSLFAYSASGSDSYKYSAYYYGGFANTGLFDVGSNLNYAVATVHSAGAAPEMNASLIPQVGLLLGCLFFLFGRKKENTEVMRAA